MASRDDRGQVWLDKGTHRALKVIAAQTGRSAGDIMAEAFEEWVRAHQAPPQRRRRPA